MELHRGARVAADTLLHEVEHLRDSDTRDVTHGDTKGQSAVVLETAPRLRGRPTQSSVVMPACRILWPTLK